MRSTIDATRPGVAWLLGICGALLVAGCSESSSDDTFDPTGAFHGPATLIGQSNGKDVSVSEDDTITLTDGTLVLAPGCALDVVESTQVGVQDSNGGDDDDHATVRQVAAVQTPLDGQMCTLQTATSGTVTFQLTDGLVTVWRASNDAIMELAVSGTTAGDGGSVTYNFTGYR